MLASIGEDPNRQGLQDTPTRAAKAMMFFTKVCLQQVCLSVRLCHKESKYYLFRVMRIQLSRLFRVPSSTRTMTRWSSSKTSKCFLCASITWCRSWAESALGTCLQEGFLASANWQGLWKSIPGGCKSRCPNIIKGQLRSNIFQHVLIHRAGAPHSTDRYCSGGGCESLWRWRRH